MVISSRRLYLTSLCLLAFSVTSANAQEQQGYTDEFISNYINSCTNGRSSEIRSICECTLRKIQEEYTFEEYKRTNAEVLASGKLPKPLADIIISCHSES